MNRHSFEKAVEAIIVPSEISSRDETNLPTCKCGDGVEDPKYLLVVLLIWDPRLQPNYSSTQYVYHQSRNVYAMPICSTRDIIAVIYLLGEFKRFLPPYKRPRGNLDGLSAEDCQARVNTSPHQCPL